MRVENWSAMVLFHDWNEHNIRYCHWKGIEHLYEGLRGDTDMDVLVNPDDKARTEKSLKENGYILVKSQYGSRYPYVEDWIGIDNETGKMLHLHLHYRIVTGHIGLKEYVLPWTDEALIERVVYKDSRIFTIDPSLEIVSLYTRIGLKATKTSLIKSIFGKYKIPKGILHEILYLKENSNEVKVVNYAKKYYGSNFTELMELISIEKYDADWLRHLNRLTRRIFKKYCRYSFVRVNILRVYYQLAIYGRYAIRKIYKDLIVKKTLYGEGMIIAFIGQDGAGKTTVTEDIEKWLSWKLHSRVLYLGSGDNYDNWKKKYIFNELKSGNVLSNLFRKYLIISYHCDSAKNMYRQMKRAKKLKKKGFIVILDRYPQIQFPGLNDGPKIRKALEKNEINYFFKKIVNYYASREEKKIKKSILVKPEMVFRLVLPIEESLKRKPDEDYKTIMKKNKIVEELVFPGSEVLTIDATMDLQEELKLVHNKIWDKIVKSYEEAVIN